MNYIEHLRHLSLAEHGMTRGERTRYQLRLAAAEILAASGYHELRVADVAGRAGVATPTFYLYYKNRKEITLDVLSDFLDHLHGTFRDIPKAASLFGMLHATNLTWLRAVQTNSGLWRCLLQLTDGDSEFAEIDQRLNHDWYVHVAETLKRKHDIQIDSTKLLMLVYTLGAMTDEFGHLLSKNPNLKTLSDKLFNSDEDMASFLSVIWYRALIGKDPKNVENTLLTSTKSTRKSKTT